MRVFLRIILEFFSRLNGVLSPRKLVLDEELKDLYISVYGFDGRLSPQNDRRNIKLDIGKVKKDFTKSVSACKKEL